MPSADTDRTGCIPPISAASPQAVGAGQVVLPEVIAFLDDLTTLLAAAPSRPYGPDPVESFSSRDHINAASLANSYARSYGGWVHATEHYDTGGLYWTSYGVYGGERREDVERRWHEQWLRGEPDPAQPVEPVAPREQNGIYTYFGRGGRK